MLFCQCEGTVPLSYLTMNWPLRLYSIKRCQWLAYNTVTAIHFEKLIYNSCRTTLDLVL